MPSEADGLDGTADHDMMNSDEEAAPSRPAPKKRKGKTTRSARPPAGVPTLRTTAMDFGRSVLGCIEADFFVTKFSFCSVLQYLQDMHTFGLFQVQHVCNISAVKRNEFG